MKPGSCEQSRYEHNLCAGKTLTNHHLYTQSVAKGIPQTLTKMSHPIEVVLIKLIDTLKGQWDASVQGGHMFSRIMHSILMTTV